MLSDSQAALKALTSVKIPSGLVVEVIEALQHLSSFNNVRLVWAQGHCGIMGNEIANFLAKQASQTPFTGPEPALGLSLTIVYLRYAVKKWSIRQQWKLRQTGCRQSKEIIRKPPDTGLRKYVVALPRKKLPILVGLLTSYTELNRHLYIMKVSDDELCPF